MRQLILSLAMLLGIEIIILFISKRLTVWIIKPVRESFEKQKQFIADASHELKTPLAVIMASSDALEAEPQEQKWLANIKSESEKMNKLITSLLDLAQSDDYTDKLELEECNLSKLTEYLDKRLEALDYASATAQALLDRNKSEATSQAKLYNEADSAAVKLAAALPTDLSEPVKAAFEKDIEDLRKKYDDARYAASAADDRIRDYLGA